MSFNKTFWKHFFGFLQMSSVIFEQNCTLPVEINKHFISLHLTHLYCSYIAEILPIHLTTCTYQSINQSLVLNSAQEPLKSHLHVCVNAISKMADYPVLTIYALQNITVHQWVPPQKIVIIYINPYQNITFNNNV